jgi:hypothetical protein
MAIMTSLDLPTAPSIVINGVGNFKYSNFEYEGERNPQTFNASFLIDREPIDLVYDKGIESYSEFIELKTEEKIKKHNPLMKNLSYRAEKNKGRFVTKKDFGYDDFYQEYCLKLHRCVELYWDQGDKKLDVLIRSAFTNKSGDFFVMRKCSEEYVEKVEDYDDNQSHLEILADKFNDNPKHRDDKTCKLSYSFDDLSGDDGEKYDIDIGSCQRAKGIYEKPKVIDRECQRDLDQYRQELITDAEFNEFMDLKDYIKDEDGEVLIGSKEIEVIGAHLNIDDIKDNNMGKKISTTDIHRELGISYSSYSKARKNIVKALEIFRQL